MCLSACHWQVPSKSDRDNVILNKVWIGNMCDFKYHRAHIFFACILSHCTIVPIMFMKVKTTLAQLTIKL